MHFSCLLRMLDYFATLCFCTFTRIKTRVFFLTPTTNFLAKSFQSKRWILFNISFQVVKDPMYLCATDLPIYTIQIKRDKISQTDVIPCCISEDSSEIFNSALQLQAWFHLARNPSSFFTCTFALTGCNSLSAKFARPDNVFKDPSSPKKSTTFGCLPGIKNVRNIT